LQDNIACLLFHLEGDSFGQCLKKAFEFVMDKNSLMLDKNELEKSLQLIRDS